MYAPEFDNNVRWLQDSCRGYNTSPAYDEASEKIIDEILQMLQKITPISDNGCRELWFCLERGPIEAYGNYEEMFEDGAVDNYDDFRESWQEEYPDEYKWYYFVGFLADNGYKSISINHRRVIEINPYHEKGHSYEITTFATALRECVAKCIRQITDGTYMDFIRPRIPDTYKTGTILQKHLWELYPDEKAAYFDGLSETDIEEFLGYMSQQDNNNYRPASRLQKMTANDFYRFCAIGYKAMGYNGCDQPLRIQYDIHADGRDEGLSEIDADSPSAFKEWLTNRDECGGHPWEVCRGGNSTHISLYVGIDDDGYYLSLSGSSYGRSAETIKFYLALRRNNLPVYLHDGDHLADRVQGKEKVGVVPQGVIPSYCHSDFPGEDVIVFMNLPYENPEIVAAKCVWQDFKEVKLIETEENNG